MILGGTGLLSVQHSTADVLLGHIPYNKTLAKLSVLVAHSYNSGTQEAEARQVFEFKSNLIYLVSCSQWELYYKGKMH